MSSGSSGPDDDRLITAFKAGDVAAFEEIYRGRFEDLCTYIATLVSDEDAADVVQDVFWTTWNARERLKVRTDAELFYFLLRATRNQALMIIRHDRVRETYQASVDTSISVQPEADPGDLRGQINALINALPPRSREVLVLRWYHGIGFEEIASLMEISYGYARLLHTRALAMLRERFQAERENEQGA